MINISTRTHVHTHIETERERFQLSQKNPKSFSVHLFSSEHNLHFTIMVVAIFDSQFHLFDANTALKNYSISSLSLFLLSIAFISSIVRTLVRKWATATATTNASNQVSTQNWFRLINSRCLRFQTFVFFFFFKCPCWLNFEKHFSKNT